jgi:hypothetical protein
MILQIRNNPRRHLARPNNLHPACGNVSRAAAFVEGGFDGFFYRGGLFGQVILSMYSIRLL